MSGGRSAGDMGSRGGGSRDEGGGGISRAEEGGDGGGPWSGGGLEWVPSNGRSGGAWGSEVGAGSVSCSSVRPSLDLQHVTGVPAAEGGGASYYCSSSWIRQTLIETQVLQTLHRLFLVNIDVFVLCHFLKFVFVCFLMILCVLN